MKPVEIVQNGVLSPDLVRQFLRDSADAYPTEVGNPNLIDWPAKLSKCATTFCIRRLDGSLSAALFAYLNTETHVGYIPFLCALPECEKGTAYRLHETYRQAAARLGMTALRLEVLQSNAHAINFYKRLGYAIVESRPDSNRYLMEYLCARIVCNSENTIL